MALAKSPLSPSGYSGLLKTRQQGGQTQTPATAPADPFAPMSSGDINQTVNRFAGMYGTPQSDAQIQGLAQGMIDPIIAAITKTINDRAAQSATNITGNANSLASSLGKIDWNAPYAAAESGQAAVDSELRDALAGGGAAQGADLQSRLAGINDPTVAAAGDALASRGSAIGGTEVANGSANLGSLLAQAAAAKTYGLKLPGIARLSGLQDVAGVNQQAVTDIGTANTSLLGQLPSIVQSLRSDNQSLRANRAGAAANEYNTLTGQNITKATAQQGFGLDVAKAQQTAAYDNTKAQISAAKLGIDQQNANTAAARAQVAAANSAARAAKSANPKLTPGQAAGIATKAAKDAQDLYHGVTKPNSKDPANPTVVAYTQTYQDAVKTLMQKYPSLGKAGVRKLVNAWYKPGEFGRPKAAPRGTTSPPGYQPGSYGKAPSTPANPGGYLPKGK